MPSWPYSLTINSFPVSKFFIRKNAPNLLFDKVDGNAPLCLIDGPVPPSLGETLTESGQGHIRECDTIIIEDVLVSLCLEIKPSNCSFLFLSMESASISLSDLERTSTTGSVEGKGCSCFASPP
uniref:Uncharacterized protein n=1 Tax=Rhizophora mucronata TaxID=61149 RepID=A0A2P2QQ30_RHIMU